MDQNAKLKHAWASYTKDQYSNTDYQQKTLCKRGKETKMKTKKMLLSAAIALSTALTPVAAMAIQSPVFAETINSDNPDSAPHVITITTTVENPKYTAYQIFKGSAIQNQSVLANVTWGSNVDTSKEGFQTKLGQLSFLNGKQGTGESNAFTAQDVANAMSSDTEAHAKEFAIMINEFLTGTGVDSETTDEGTKISVTGDGYYLIKDGTDAPATQLPTRFIMKVVNNVTVEPKVSGVPDREKKVKENTKEIEKSGNGNPINPEIVSPGYNDVADYSIGDSVPFELGAVIPDLTEFSNYVMTFHDTYDEGFTVNTDNIKVYAVDSTNAPQGTEITSGFTITETKTDDKVTGFDVKVNVKSNENALTYGVGENSKSLTQGVKLIVRFEATLNGNAKLNKVGNENRYVLEYTNNPSTGGTGRTTEDKVVVFTYTMKFDKVDSGEGKAPLSGAKFKLYRVNGNNNEYLKVTGEKGAYKVDGWTTNEEEASELEGAGTNSNEFIIHGLDDGHYKLKETVAPEGYNLPSNDLDIYLAANTHNNQNYDGTPGNAIGAIKVGTTEIAFTGENANKDVDKVNVENTKGTSLPETGGMGTTMLYAAGAIMVGGAAVLLVTNKRMKKQD